MDTPWTRIPSPIDTDADRRELAATLDAYGPLRPPYAPLPLR